ncbi:stage V sporulation protein K, partial [Oceanobacillus caeni]
MESQINRHKNGQINIVLHENKRLKAENGTNIGHKQNNPFKNIDSEFRTFIGMDKLKSTVKEIYATLVINEKRNELGLKNSKQVLHMLFKG